MNCNPAKFFGIIILFSLCSHHGFAQVGQTLHDSAVAPPQGTAQLDTSEYFGDTAVTKNVFESSGDSIRKWKHHTQFGYMAYIDSLLRKRKGTLRMDTISVTHDRPRSHETSSSGEDAPSFLNDMPVKIFFWIVAMFFILFILYRVLIKGGLFEGNRKSEEGDIAPAEPEKLNEYDAYNNLIEAAEIRNDYNLATRYLFLQSLKKLSDHELILFAPDKTNSAYIAELSGKNYQQEFSYLTMNYEYLWYGKFSISRDRYLQLKSSFQSFNKKV